MMGGLAALHAFAYRLCLRPGGLQQYQHQAEATGPGGSDTGGGDGSDGSGTGAGGGGEGGGGGDQGGEGGGD